MKLNRITVKLFIAASLFWLAVPFSHAGDPVRVMDQKTQQAMSPAQALELLKQGNQRFVKGNTMGWDYQAQVGVVIGICQGLTAGQTVAEVLMVAVVLQWPRLAVEK